MKLTDKQVGYVILLLIEASKDYAEMMIVKESFDETMNKVFEILNKSNPEDYGYKIKTKKETGTKKNPQ